MVLAVPPGLRVREPVGLYAGDGVLQPRRRWEDAEVPLVRGPGGVLVASRHAPTLAAHACGSARRLPVEVAASGPFGWGVHVEIWLNPACSKCRAATAALDEAGIAYTVRRYLDEPPTRAELEDVLARLGLEPWDITRMREPESSAVKDLPRTEAARSEWVQALVDHPRLIQRPIITADDGTTVVGRDPESLAKVVTAEA